ncbi:MAG: tRNA (adenosine(37)-N6)-dimethylallyltransferase MiaA [Clostridiales bacterium]|nr:tRNA (adenosine(37)-N6)-dimethylallyltransferase MiaA [Clostridiales bacterium]
MMNKIIIIAGPTASGKSKLAIEVAKKLHSEIISCDSMQIYKYMDVGTAKIMEDEMQGIKHHMINIVNPDEEYSVSDYAKEAKAIIDDMHKKNMIPIICGGTGLYVDALLYPLQLGAKDDAVRERLQEEYEKHGANYMHDKLKAIDPKEAEKVHANNVKRVLRALEIYELTGKTKSEQDDREKELNYDALLICLNPDRDELYERINDRVEDMFDNKLEIEVQDLVNMGYNFNLQSMQAIGYKEFRDFISDRKSLEEVKEEIKTNSRHYAKRQITWFKRYDFCKFFEPNDKENIYKAIDEFVGK